MTNTTSKILACGDCNNCYDDIQKVYVVKSYGNHMVLFMYDGTGLTWDAKGEWDRPCFFRCKAFAQRVARVKGGEVIEWKGMYP